MSEAFTWPVPAAATGVGSMPGTDAREATNIVVGEFGAVPHLVELPARGPGGDPVGRTASMLAQVDRTFEVETTTSGWRVGHTGQGVLRRARTWLSEDLEAFEEYARGHSGFAKAQILGPWSLAARIEDQAGESLIRDPGAVAELAGAVAEAARDLISRMRLAAPEAPLIVQVDEPELRRVLDGRVRMSSGRLFHRSAEAAVVQGHLSHITAAVRGAGAVSAIRCAAAGAPIDLIVGSGAEVIALDLALPLESPDALPQLWESGIGLMLGCVPATTDLSRSDTQVSAPLRRFMDRAGFSDVPASVAVTPRTGLAHLDLESARAVMDACIRLGSVVRDEHPEVAHG